MNQEPRSTRKLKEWHYLVKPLDIGLDFEHEPLAWLTKQAKALNEQDKAVTEHMQTPADKALPVEWLLVYTEDGVIWGKWTGQQFDLSTTVFPQPTGARLHHLLRQVRLFGVDVEVLVWHDGDTWRARLIDDRGTDTTGWCFDEPHLQWGDHAEGVQGGFTLLADGVQGLRHAVPLTDLQFDRDTALRPVRLGVRQYVSADADGLLVITQGRLYGLWAESARRIQHG